MSRLLDELLDAEMIQRISSDERMAKTEAAADALAERFCETPGALIGATLAGLDARVPEDDPAIAAARDSLQKSWRTYRANFNDEPIELFRWMLLDACQQAAADDPGRAAIVWLTAADRLRVARLGRIEAPVRAWLRGLAEVTEELASAGSRPLHLEHLPALKKLAPKPLELAPPQDTDRDKLEKRVFAAAGPQGKGGVAITGANPHWPNRNAHWSWDFAPRMAQLLADGLDSVRNEAHQAAGTAHAGVAASHVRFAELLNKTLDTQRRWLRDSLKAFDDRLRSGDTRLNALWWSEARYSPSLGTGYRTLPPAVAAVAMAHDLLTAMPAPSPASVGYLLAETVAVLPEAGFDRRRPIGDWLADLVESQGALPPDWAGSGESPVAGRFAFPDLVQESLSGAEPAGSLDRAGLDPDDELSLPDLAHALFRQGQARRIVEDAS